MINQDTSLSKFETLLVDAFAISGQNQKAFDQFQKLGLPTKKWEEYKHLPIASYLDKQFVNLVAARKDTVKSTSFDAQTWHQIKQRIVIVNGKFEPSLSSVNDSLVHVTDSTELIELDTMKVDPFYYINQSFNPKGLKIEVAKNKQAGDLAIYHVISGDGEPSMVSPSIQIIMQQGSQLNIAEKTICLNSEAVFHNKITYGEISENANLNITRIQSYNANLTEVDGTFLEQSGNSKLIINTFTFDAGLIRNNLNIRQNGSNSETFMYGMYLLKGKSQVDNHTVIDHRFPHAYSNELYKGIVDEQARAIFNGKIFVRPGAQQTNAYQSNKNISLSDAATINTKPQLEIWADDVKCSHGCTIGQLDDEAVFYMRARGLSERSAKAMLLFAFAEATLEHVPFDFIKEELQKTFHQRLD